MGIRAKAFRKKGSLAGLCASDLIDGVDCNEFRLHTSRITKEQKRRELHQQSQRIFAYITPDSTPAIRSDIS